MKKIFTSIKQWLQAYGERMRADRSKAKLDRLETESKRRLQVMEYEGEVYLSYDGVPLLTEDEFGSDLVEALGNARENWKKYQWTKEAI